MFTRIMVPVDLAHLDKQEKALECAAMLSRQYDAPITYVGVTTPTPGPLAHTPEEYDEKLGAFAAAQAELRGIKAQGHMAIAHDPTTDLDDVLLKQVSETGADLVVMASHVPGVTEYIWPSNGGKIAGHAKASVLVVR